MKDKTGYQGGGASGQEDPSLKNLAIALVLMAFVSCTLILGSFTMTGMTVFDGADVFASQDTYNVGDMVHISLTPPGINYEVEVYGPDNELYAVSLDFPVEKAGTYNVKAALSSGNETKTVYAKFKVVDKEETPVINNTASNVTEPSLGSAEAEVIKQVGDPVKDEDNKVVGKKVKDEKNYETFFVFVGKENDEFKLSLYHNNTQPLPIWIEGDVEANISNSLAAPNETIDITVPLVDGNIPRFKLHVGPDSDVFEFGITVMNVQSYPTVFGNWTVRFTTEGTADLVITPINGTQFGNDINFLELRCGDTVLEASYDGTRAYYPSFSCDNESAETSKVMTSGKHHLMFEFGDATAFANNDATENSEGSLSEWRMFGRWLNNTRWDGQAYGTIDGLKEATYTTGAQIESSPAVAGGYVYAGGFDSNIYQFNASNISQLIATYAAGSIVLSSPAVAGGYVYAGDWSGNMYQFNASNISQLVATYAISGGIYSSPAVANGYVYVGSWDKKLYQLNASDISQFIASYTSGNYILSSPAVANGYVYIGSGDNNTYQLNASNVSQQIANYSTGGALYSLPAVANGYVYFGGSDNNTYQLNASNISQLVATYDTGGAINYVSPAVAGGYAYIGSDDGKVYQLNASNISQLVATYSTGFPTIRSSPVVSNGYVYIGSGGKAYQLNASNISQMVAVYVAGGQFLSSPAVTDSYVYMGNDNGKLYQIRASNIDVTPPSVSLSGPQNNTFRIKSEAQHSFYVSDYSGTANCTMYWGDYSPASSQNFGFVSGTVDAGNVISPDGIVSWFVNCTDMAGNTGTSDVRQYTVNASLVGLGTESSEGSLSEWRMFRRWLNHSAWDGQNFSLVAGLNMTGYLTGAEVYSSPTVANGYVYAGSNDYNVYQFNASNISQHIANFTTGNIVSSSPAVANGYVYAGSADGNVYQLNASDVSQEIANYSIGSAVSPPAVANGYVYAGSADGNVYQLNASDVSQLVATYTTGNTISSSTPAVTDNFVYVADDSGILYQLYAKDISQLVTTTSGGDVLSSPAVTNGYVYAGCLDGSVYQFNASDISQLITTYATGAPVASSPAVANGYVYIGSQDNNLYQLNASDISQLISTYTTTGAVDLSPAVADGYVYIGDGSTSLYKLNASNISQQIANFTIGGNVSSSPAVANGYVYLGSDDYNIYQINASHIGLLNVNVAPTITSVLLNATSVDNLTTDNLTATAVATDPDGDNIELNYNWYRNGVSDAILNMPMTAPDLLNRTYDFSGNGNNGNVSNGTFWNSTGGYDGFGAYQFDGVDDYMAINHSTSLNILSNFTVSLWVFHKGIINRYIMMKGASGNGFSISSQDNPLNSYRFDVGAVYATAGANSVVPNTWQHIVGVWNGTDIIIYLNGVFKNSASQTTIPANTNNIILGKRQSVNSYFNGTIDDIRIYNRSMSANEIALLYENKTNVTHTDATTAGDNWTVKVTPIDQYGLNGTFVFSNSINITQMLLSFVNQTTSITGRVVNDTSPMNLAENLIINVNATVIGGGLDSVWIIVWQTVKSAANIIWSGLMSFVGGFYQANVTVNSSYPEGVVNYTIYANLTGGNITQIEGNFSIDSINPSVGYGGSTEADGSYKSQGWIYINVSVVEANFNNITFRLYNSAGLLNETNFTTQAYSVNFTNLADNTYWYNVTVADIAGNTNSTPTRSIILSTAAPNITTISPINRSGDSDGNITFSYNVTSAAPILNCSLLLDSQVNQTNSSIARNTTMTFSLEDMPEGNYAWSVNCSDSAYNNGWSGQRKIAVILSTQYITTDLSLIDVSDVTWFYIEQPTYGKINFSERVNLSAGMDINGNVNISFNKIELNSTALPQLNKSATLYLYNLTFTDPRMLMDGSVCPSSVCTKISYSGGILVFNVTHFTTYSAEETPVETAAPDTTAPSKGGGGGGAGGAVIRSPAAFGCEKDSDCAADEACINHECVKLFDVKIMTADSLIQPGDYLDFVYFIKGMANVSGDVVMDFWLAKDNNIVTSGSDTIYMGVFEEKTEKSNIFLPSDTPVGIYELYVQVTYGNYRAISYRMIQVEVSVPLLLDMNIVDIPQSTSQDIFKFSPILSFNKDAPAQVYLEEKITKGSRVVWEKQRDLIVDRSSILSETVGRLEAGRYQIELIGHYENKTSRLVKGFEIGKSPQERQPLASQFKVAGVGVGIIAIVACIMIMFFRKRKKKGQATLEIGPSTSKTIDESAVIRPPQEPMLEHEKIREGLIERIRLCEEYKRKIILAENCLLERYSRGLIDEAEYKRRHSIQFRGREPEEWIKYYNNYIGLCREKLSRIGIK